MPTLNDEPTHEQSKPELPSEIQPVNVPAISKDHPWFDHTDMDVSPVLEEDV